MLELPLTGKRVLLHHKKLILGSLHAIGKLPQFVANHWRFHMDKLPDNHLYTETNHQMPPHASEHFTTQYNTYRNQNMKISTVSPQYLVPTSTN